MAGCAVYAEAPLAYQAAGDEAWDHALGFGKWYATPQLHDPCGTAVHSPVCWCWCSTTIQNQRQWWNSDSCGGFSDSVAYVRKLCQEHGAPKTSSEATHCNCNTRNSAFWRQVALMALLHSVKELPLQPCYCHGNSLKVTCCVLGYGGSPPDSPCVRVPCSGIMRFRWAILIAGALPESPLLARELQQSLIRVPTLHVHTSTDSYRTALAGSKA